MSHSDPTALDPQVFRDACGLVERRADLLELTGAERQRFLNGLVTCDVKDLEPGQGVFGFLTQVKGRILADVEVLALEDRLRLVLPAGRGAAIAEHLGKYVLFDPVEIVDPEPHRALRGIGPRSIAILEELGLAVPEAPLAHTVGELAGCGVLAVRDDHFGVPGWTLWLPAQASDAVSSALVDAGAAPAAPEAFEILRVEAGRPLFGRDFNAETFPQETGLEDAVSYTKGCYLGQEVVARIHYRGGVQKLLRGLRFTGALEPVGRSVLHDGREAGRVTSAAASPTHGAIGLGILHRRVEPGMDVALEGGGTAMVTALPF